MPTKWPKREPGILPALCWAEYVREDAFRVTGLR